MKTLAGRLKGIKIVQGVVIVWIISLLATITIGVVGLTNISKQYSTTKEINSTIIPRLVDWEDVNGNMGLIRNTVTKIVDRDYDEGLVTQLNQLHNQVQTIMKRNVEASKGTPEEADLAKKVTDSYDKYYSYLPTIIEQRKQGHPINSQMINEEMTKVGNALTQDILNAVQYQKRIADEKSIYSKSLYESSLRVFVLIFVVSLVILSVTSLFVIMMIRTSMKDFISKVERVAEGDVTVEFNGQLRNEFGMMNRALNQTILSIRTMLQTIGRESERLTGQTVSLSAAADTMNTSVSEVSTAIHEVSLGSVSQAEELSSMTESFHLLGEQLEIIAGTLKTVDNTAKVINDKAENSSGELNELMTSVNGIAESFGETQSKVGHLMGSISRITEITQFIGEISNQTNLLSLNASIEAARAGDAGRGFAVVAGEIRKLAEQSQNSSSSIDDLLREIEREMNAVSETSEKTGEVLAKQSNVVITTLQAVGDIIQSIRGILPEIERITALLVKFNQDKDSVLLKASSASAVAQQNSASAEEISASTIELAGSTREIGKSIQELEQLAREMIQSMSRFKLE
ncbi:methyl-accepting chemotaxis protein [Paenibacillus puldeungensis]|uniref:Methyl-accepting chemotaxis protein n=1 Tax=Paenibacillus puldeungensis TaxID=696536 RepID=A0ABW3RSQ1_9BACL